MGKMVVRWQRWALVMVTILLAGLLLVACGGGDDDGDDSGDDTANGESSAGESEVDDRPATVAISGAQVWEPTWTATPPVTRSPVPPTRTPRPRLTRTLTPTAVPLDTPTPTPVPFLTQPLEQPIQVSAGELSAVLAEDSRISTAVGNTLVAPPGISFVDNLLLLDFLALTVPGDPASARSVRIELDLVVARGRVDIATQRSFFTDDGSAYADPLVDDVAAAVLAELERLLVSQLPDYAPEYVGIETVAFLPSGELVIVPLLLPPLLSVTSADVDAILAADPAVSGAVGETLAELPTARFGENELILDLQVLETPGDVESARPVVIEFDMGVSPGQGQAQIGERRSVYAGTDGTGYDSPLKDELVLVVREEVRSLVAEQLPENVRLIGLRFLSVGEVLFETEVTLPGPSIVFTPVPSLTPMPDPSAPEASGPETAGNEDNQPDQPDDQPAPGPGITSTPEEPVSAEDDG
ncbi:MAG: hypothetical protein GYB65_02810 [Chloroflexi bacterium]|nr:hypothetical protein [Chloroflexota bacterium]